MKASPKVGPWRGMWRCTGCRSYGDVTSMGPACPACGSQRFQPMAARPVRYTLLHRLLLLLTGHKQPRNYWETNDHVSRP